MSKEIIGVFYDDPKISTGDLERISILNKNNCSEKWIAYVSAINRHFMLMDDDEWPAKIVDNSHYWYRWIEDWNENKFCKFKVRLQSLNILADSTLYVFWMKEIGLKTNWEVFFNNWGNFLYEDEGCILVLPKYNKALVLSNGSAWLGKRGKPKE